MVVVVASVEVTVVAVAQLQLELYVIMMHAYVYMSIDVHELFIVLSSITATRLYTQDASTRHSAFSAIASPASPV